MILALALDNTFRLKYGPVVLAQSFFIEVTSREADQIASLALVLDRPEYKLKAAMSKQENNRGSKNEHPSHLSRRLPPETFDSLPFKLLSEFLFLDEDASGELVSCNYLTLKAMAVMCAELRKNAFQETSGLGLVRHMTQEEMNLCKTNLIASLIYTRPLLDALSKQECCDHVFLLYLYNMNYLLGLIDDPEEKEGLLEDIKGGYKIHYYRLYDRQFSKKAPLSALNDDKPKLYLNHVMQILGINRRCGKREIVKERELQHASRMLQLLRVQLSDRLNPQLLSSMIDEQTSADWRYLVALGKLVDLMKGYNQHILDGGVLEEQFFISSPFVESVRELPLPEFLEDGRIVNKLTSKSRLFLVAANEDLNIVYRVCSERLNSLLLGDLPLMRIVIELVDRIGQLIPLLKSQHFKFLDLFCGKALELGDIEAVREVMDDNQHGDPKTGLRATPKLHSKYYNEVVRRTEGYRIFGELKRRLIVEPRKSEPVNEDREVFINFPRETEPMTTNEEGEVLDLELLLVHGVEFEDPERSLLFFRWVLKNSKLHMNYESGAKIARVQLNLIQSRQDVSLGRYALLANFLCRLLECRQTHHDLFLLSAYLYLVLKVMTKFTEEPLLGTGKCS